MAEDKLGRFMKDKVFHHPSSVDADALWQKIHLTQIADKPNRKAGLFWIWGAGVIVLLAIGFFAKPYLSSSKAEATNLNPTVTTNDFGTKENLVEEQLVSKEIEKQIESAANVSDLEEITDESERIPSLSTKNTVDLRSNIATVKKRKDNIVLPKETNPANLKTNTSIVNQANIISSPTQSIKQDLVRSKQLANEKNIAQNKLRILTETPDRYMPMSILTIEDLTLTEFPTLNPGAWDKTPSPSRRGNYFNYSIGANLTYGSSLKTLTAKSEEWEAFKQLREDSETKLEVFGAALDFKMEHSSGLYAKIGLEYEQINERFDFDVFEERTYIDDNQLLKIIYDQNGVPTEVYGPGEVKETFTYMKKVYNSYRMFDVPLMIGYNFGYEKFGLFIESGVAMNVLFSPEGELFESADNPVKLTEEKASIFNTNLGVSILGGIGLSYQLSDQIKFYLSPRLKYRPNSITIKDYPLEQKYFNTAIQLGFRYQLSDN